jgi:hypothetical protein
MAWLLRVEFHLQDIAAAFSLQGFIECPDWTAGSAAVQAASGLDAA